MLCDWLLDSVFYTKENNARVTMEFEVCRKHILRPYIYPLIWFDGFYCVVGEVKEVLLIQTDKGP